MKIEDKILEVVDGIYSDLDQGAKKAGEKGDPESMMELLSYKHVVSIVKAAIEKTIKEHADQES